MPGCEGVRKEVGGGVGRCEDYASVRVPSKGRSGKGGKVGLIRGGENTWR